MYTKNEKIKYLEEENNNINKEYKNYKPIFFFY